MSVYGYVRASTLGQTVEAQRAALEAARVAHGWPEMAVVEEKASGKGAVDDRPVLAALVAGMQAGDVLVVSKLDRLARSVAAFGDVLERARLGGWALVVGDLGVDMTAPGGKLVATVLVAVAEWEREMISLRTREQMAAKKEAGTFKRPPGRAGHRDPGAAVGGGRPVELPTATVGQIRDLLGQGMSRRAVARELNRRGVEGPRGGCWHESALRRVEGRAEAA